LYICSALQNQTLFLTTKFALKHQTQNFSATISTTKSKL
jgi:hypothetical protein